MKRTAKAIRSHLPEWWCIGLMLAWIHGSIPALIEALGVGLLMGLYGIAYHGRKLHELIDTFNATEQP